MTKKLEKIKKTYKNFKDVLKTKPEYKNLLPQLSDKKFKGLKDDIKAAGIIYDPIIIDEDGVILDGHHRYKIAEMLDLSYRTEVYKIKNIDQKRLWLVGHQKNRRELTKDQWAVIGLDFLPYFTEVCRLKKSEGGKNKKSTDKPLVATDMAGKEVGVNSVMMKQVKSINDHIPEFLPFIKNGEYSIRDGKYLQKNCPEGYMVDKGNLTDYAKKMLKEYNSPVLTDDEIKANELQKEADKLRLKTAKDKKDKIERDKAQALEDAKKLKAENEAGDPPPDDNSNLPTDKNVDPPKPKLSDEEKKAKIASLEITKFVTGLSSKVKKEVFVAEAILHDGRKEPERMVSKLIAALKMMSKGKESTLPPNNVLVIPNTMLNMPWSQLITSVSTLSIDSNQHPLRILYFGKETMVFYAKFARYGVISASIKQNPNKAKTAKK